jgi:hypothetical protein
MKNVMLAIALVFGATAVGCTPSPEKVCNHMFEIVSKEMKGDKKISDDDKKKGMDDCTKKLGEEKEKDPEAYKCASKCMMDAKDFEGVMGCEDKCGTKKKKGGDDDKKKESKDDDSKDKKKKDE